MANHMAEVAKILGIELGEEFEIVFPNNPNCYATAILNENGLHIEKHNLANQDFWYLTALTSLLTGTYTIKRKPWKPKHGDYYWVVHCDGYVYNMCYCCSNEDKTFYKIGNCYRAREEAEANRDKWVKFYDSDEVLEV